MDKAEKVLHSKHKVCQQMRRKSIVYSRHTPQWLTLKKQADAFTKYGHTTLSRHICKNMWQEIHRKIGFIAS